MTEVAHARCEEIGKREVVSRVGGNTGLKHYEERTRREMIKDCLRGTNAVVVDLVPQWTTTRSWLTSHLSVSVAGKL